MDSKKFLSVEEVAAEFGLSADSLKAFVDSGDVRALADRGTWKYRRDELEALVSSGRIEKASSEFGLGEVLPSGTHSTEDVEYIELDEDALAEQASIDNPVSADAEQDWFVPSDAVEMTEKSGKSGKSSSDVEVYTGEEAVSAEPTSLKESSDSDVVLMPGTKPADRLAEDGSDWQPLGDGSDSDVRIASNFEAPKPEDSGILLDFNLDAGATVSSSGSSLHLPQTNDVTDAEADSLRSEIDLVETDIDSSVWDDSGTAGAAETGSEFVKPQEDSGIQLVDELSSGVKLGIEESGILLDEGSRIGMPSPGSSILVGSGSGVVGQDSGIALNFLDEEDRDSGISLEGEPVPSAADEDSGISLVGDDSGLALSSGESGIALAGNDSGLSLRPADSGLALDSGDSGLAIDMGTSTLADVNLFSDDLEDSGGQTIELTRGSGDDSEFDIGADATAELILDEEDVADDSSATVVRKGRDSKRPGLSGAFELDDSAEVEDLEISEDLDAGEDEEVEEFAEEDAVLDASDDVFSGDEVEASEDDDYLEPAAAARKPSGPREPAWGVDMVIGLVACSLFLGVNVVVLWSGVSTMWTGAEALPPAAPLIDSLGGLIGR